MKIGFIYNAPLNIVEFIQNPLQSPAAPLCYLAIQLAKLGVDITIFSYGPSLAAFNVRCRHIEVKDQALVLDPALLEKDFNILIFKDTSPEFAISIKRCLPYAPKIFLWNDLDLQSSLNNGLSNATLIANIDGIVCASAYQRALFIEKLFIPHAKVFAILHGVAPVFEDLFIDGKELFAVKSKTLRIAYLAAEDDGLDILLDSYYNINDNYANVQLGIFTNITKQENLQRIQEFRGISVYGNLPKIQLLKWLRSYTIFANPNTIPVNFNDILLETMAADLYPVTSDIGANTEYCAGHGKIVNHQLLYGSSLDNYISELLSICQAQIHQATDFFNYCFKQAADINKKYTWRVRAKDWIELLEKHVAGKQT